MTVYTIDDFWRVRLPQAALPGLSPIAGWSSVGEGLPTFKEAPLTLSAELTPDGDPATSPLLLISAPGAVGKSTLAREVAFRAGAVYIDLATADPVGGNTISGGLVRSGLYEKWKAGAVTLLIDGLDEARLRVTQEGFEAFLGDVVELAKGRSAPTVLFGRTGAIQDAWILMSDKKIPLAVLEIGYYDPEASLEFAEARVRALRKNGAHAQVDRQAVQLLLERLRQQTEADGDRFAGYAPVLQAVANRVAAEPNPAALIAQVNGGDQPVTLQSVVTSILTRERDKLRPLRFEDATLADKLYLPEEQLDRLVARVHRLSPPDLPPMSPADSHTYSTALEQWVGEHPFLNGGHEASSAVFDAVISVHAMKTASSAEAATQRELRRGAANPFLAEFYLPQEASTKDTRLPPEHIGIVYASLRARLSIGDSANLFVEGDEDASDEDALRAVVEISLDRRDADRPRILQFETDQTGSLRLGAHIEDVELAVPHARVEIGPGQEVLLVAPVSIQCDTLQITADKLIAECPQGRKAASVHLQARAVQASHITSVPVLRGDATLSVAWPGARSHPWTSFATEPTPIDDPRLDEAARRLRRFVTAFRSHSKGSLARYQDKIEHARMTKGSGKAVLALLISEKVLSLHGNMYHLDPDLLARQVGTTYAECTARRFGSQTLDFLKRALAGAS